MNWLKWSAPAPQPSALWCVHFYRYRALIVVDGRRFEVQPGSVTVFPPGKTIEYHYQGKSVHAYAHFSLPAAGRAAQRIPVLQEVPVLRLAFEEAIGWAPSERLRAEVRLWDILWQLTNGASASASMQPHPAVEAAMREIELHLGEVIYMAELTRKTGFLQNHLTRLFTAATGKTMAAYIRDRRVERAAHLLRHSTLPVKAIAFEVGIPDLHLFNKSIRRAFGIPPRRLRG